MSKITITEALAEIKTINARIGKKQQFIGEHLWRQERMRDPLEKDGGSREAIRRERQAIADLGERQLNIRRAIQMANEETDLTVNGVTRSIADWLVWRREVAPVYKSLLANLSTNIQAVRQDAMRKGLQTVTTADVATNPNDVVINLDERQLAEEIENMETILGGLDGQLSLKNALVTIDL